MADLTTQPYKGTRDFYPEDMRAQRYIFNVWRTVAERFGYEEVNAPLLESTDIYRAKTGDELVNEQSYNFTDRGGREVTIRPEMTPSMARMVAARNQELAYPLRWYSIANFWRYERPQKGRLREHWQLNVDVFGSDSVEADAEIIRVADNVLRAFGADDEHFAIHINSRKLMGVLLGEHLKLDVEKSHRVLQLIDRKNKMSEQAFSTQLNSVMGAEADKLLNLLSIKSIDELPTDVVESGLAEELRMLFEILSKNGIKNTEFDLTIARGFEYYTGVVFEVFDKNPVNKRSIVAGGRYDELTGLFSGPNVPGVGFGMGDVTVKDFLETNKLLPDLNSSAKVYVIVIGSYLEQAQQVARELRQAGVNVAVDISGKKPEAQLKSALKNSAPFALFVGEKEVKAKKYNLKDLSSEQEETLSLKDIASKLS